MGSMVPCMRPAENDGAGDAVLAPPVDAPAVAVRLWVTSDVKIFRQYAWHETQWWCALCSARWTLVGENLNDMPQSWRSDGAVYHPLQGDSFVCEECHATWRPQAAS